MRLSLGVIVVMLYEKRKQLWLETGNEEQSPVLQSVLLTHPATLGGLTLHDTC